MSDFTRLPRNIADCMKRAGAELSEDQKMLLAGYLAPVQQRIGRLEYFLNLTLADVDADENIYSEASKCLNESPTQSPQHPDDLGVSKLANAMRDKLRLKREQGRSGWDNPEACTTRHLADLLVEHVGKGDYVDIANFCMMLYCRGAGKEEIQQSLQQFEAAAVDIFIRERFELSEDTKLSVANIKSLGVAHNVQLRQQATEFKPCQLTPLPSGYISGGGTLCTTCGETTDEQQLICPRQQSTKDGS